VSQTAGPTRVAFCITDLDPGGAERALVKLATGLDRDRWEPAVYCLAPAGSLVAELETAGVPVVCFGVRGGRDGTVLWRLERELRRFRPHILQTFLFHANLAGRIAARWAGIPYIVAGIRVADRRYRSRLWLDRLTNGLVDCNVCVSRGVAEFSIHEGRLDPAKVVVIPNGVDVRRFAEAPPADLSPFGIPPGCFVFVSVGRLDPQKGYLVLLDAVGQLRRELGPEDAKRLRVLIVGEGPERSRLEERIAASGLAECITLAGWQADVPGLLRAAAAYVHPALWEGLPNALLEAMAAGLPVVAARAEGVDEVVCDGETGLLVNSGDAPMLARAMRTLIERPEQRHELGRRGQLLVAEHFTWGRVIGAYEDLYLSLLAGQNPVAESAWTHGGEK